MKIVREKDQIFHAIFGGFNMIYFNDIREVIQKDGSIIFDTNYNFDNVAYILKLFKKYKIKYSIEKQYIKVNYKDMSFLIKQSYL